MGDTKCLFVWAQMHGILQARTCTEASKGCHTSCSVTLTPIPLTQSLSLNLNLELDW